MLTLSDMPGGVNDTHREAYLGRTELHLSIIIYIHVKESINLAARLPLSLPQPG